MDQERDKLGMSSISKKISLSWPGSGQTIVVEKQGSLLELIIAAGVPLPNSCRRGDCQQCACSVRRGDFYILNNASENSSLQFHLACQVVPVSGLDVELFEDPYEEIEKPRHIPAKVVRLDRLSSNVFCLSLVLPRNQSFTFRPGQYTDIKLRSGLVRSYSIASYSGDSRILEFHIRVVDGGRFGEWLNTAVEGEMVQIYGPLGRFFFRDKIDVKQTIMAATGTGIAPIYCMLSVLSPAQRRQLGKISIIWGNRSAAGNYFDASVTALAQKLGAEYHAVYSAEATAPFKGRITDWMPSDFSETQVFAAGHPLMVADLRSLAYARGLPHSFFYADAFSFASPATEQV